VIDRDKPSDRELPPDGDLPPDREPRPDGNLPTDIVQALAEAIVPVTMPPDRSAAIKARLLERAEASRPGGLTTIRSAQGDWRPFLPRVSMKVLREEGSTRTYLLKLQPGAIVVPHHHPEDEECIVLEGEVRIGDLVARAGDYHLAPRGVDHGAIVSETGALLFLRGAIPAASQVKWSSLETIAALSLEPVRRFVRDW
jgi:quercetin dioxygenase-like cupin family protein